jgi:hypothetical protein
VPTFVDRRVSRGQRGGTPTVINLFGLISQNVNGTHKLLAYVDYVNLVGGRKNTEMLIGAANMHMCSLHIDTTTIDAAYL